MPESTAQKGEFNLQNLPDDLIFSVLEYSSTHDLCQISSCNKFLMNSTKANLLWAKFCASRWNLECDEILEDFASLSSTNFKLLYKYVWPMCKSLASNDEKITCRGPLAVCHGIGGQGYRNIQSSSCFPPLPEDRSMIRLRDYFCHMFLKRSFKWLLKSEATLFSCPFKDSFFSVFNFSPRNIAYYEVTIDRESEYSSEEYIDRSSHECVAIGLATHGFFLQKRLPGWDSDSYGYHGDDGGIFHGHGQLLEIYGPRFGVGDVVGCGLNYATRSIFFCLNGEYLGSAFRDVPGGQTLYPTVGVDANLRLHFNFGATPFRFALSAFLRIQSS